ncbi:MAG TPA: energy transducer TonB [Candidatus Acidoferrales bacterium]|jgi:protein TonB|nr:energy transducer TonB [Candidatus Acidoferrales bacterium]
MFEDLIECSPAGKKKTRAGLTVFISTVFQILLLGVMILIPLIYTEALPKQMLTTFLVAPPPPPPPPPPPAPVQKVVRPMAKLMQAGKLQAPTAIPKQVTMLKEEEPPPDTGVGVVGGVPGGVPGGQAGGVLGGIIGGVVSSLPPPPKAAPQRIRQGGNVQQAKLINMVRPVYPALARQARVSGTVRLHAIIAKDGTVSQLEVLQGHPLLVQAAQDAVRQWRYQPTLLNGEPVEVDTTIDVVFTLGG